ncbi:alpha/beta fold hydrolase [Amycolatopsis cihanbeyliensis]|uniref:alpha/beta fold hydrolase n=1 Tax=Amycolatopsis cihanbeyliensis TaxID=1128664 RepID=UPI0014772909|nr:alpha/beta hydrolase [Amycolatopsis cihanbeyliensis]
MISGFANDKARKRYAEVYDAILDWPLPYEDLTVETSFGPTYVRRSGGDGEPLVLLHGFTVTSLMWQRYAAELGRDHVLYAVDSMGEPGRSVQTAPMPDARANADWLAEVLDSVGHDKVHLVGLSRGGWLALNQAIHRPERVSRVTAFDPAGFFRSWLRVYGYLWTGLLTMFLPGFLRRRIKADSKYSGFVDPAIRRLMIAQLPFRMKAFMIGDFTDEGLRGISVPTRIILAGRSPLHDAREVQARLARLAPGVETEIVDTSHGLDLVEPTFLRDRIMGHPRS